jgi:hypothetical protein
MSDTAAPVGSPAPAASAPAAPARSPGAERAFRYRERQRDATAGDRDGVTRDGTSPARKLSVRGKEYDEQAILDAMAEQAERTVKKQGLPQNPSGYETKLPGNFVLPHGLEFKFCPEDAPGIDQAKQFALAHGLDQSAFEQMLSIHAATTLAGESARREFARTEELKLGSYGNQRLTDAHTWLKSMAGDDGAAALMVGVVTARQVEAIEALQRRFSAQGGTSFTQSGRDADNRPSNEEFDSWTYAAQRAYTKNGGTVR